MYFSNVVLDLFKSACSIVTIWNVRDISLNFKWFLLVYYDCKFFTFQTLELFLIDNNSSQFTCIDHYDKVDHLIILIS